MFQSIVSQKQKGTREIQWQSSHQQARETETFSIKDCSNQTLLRMDRGVGILPVTSLRPSQTTVLQRKCVCNSPIPSLSGENEEFKGNIYLQTKLTIGSTNDPLEQEADRIAEQVLRISDSESAASPQISRKCAKYEEDDAKKLHTKPAISSETSTRETPAIVHEALRSPGQPLDAATRAFFEPRFGYNFSDVRVHTNERAADSARDINALAFTFGRNIVFGASQYNPFSDSGRRLLAHELTHVMQQKSASPCDGAIAAPLSAAPSPGGASIQRQTPVDQGDVNQGGEVTGLTPGSRLIPASCTPSPICPLEYCKPFATKKEAEDDRNKNAESLLGDIDNVCSRARPLYKAYIDGGSVTKDISANYATDFTNSDTTIAVTQLLVKNLEDVIKASPPTFPPDANVVTVNIKDVLNEDTIKQITGKMRFTNYTTVPGLIAGGIDTAQGSCPVGNIPSTQPDNRRVEGTVTVIKNTDGTLSISRDITYAVQDTLDFCPGNCGPGLVQKDTVPMSRWEASGISGDLPFTVQFPAPSLTGAFDSEE